MAKLKARALGPPTMLRPFAEVQAEKAAEYERLLRQFLDWFEEVPGAEWETASECGMMLYCRYYANAEHPEWGKAFCAVWINKPLPSNQKLMATCPPPLEWDHWKYLDLDPSSSRKTVIARFHAKSALYPREQHPREHDFIERAYRRCLADLYAGSDPGAKK